MKSTKSKRKAGDNTAEEFQEKVKLALLDSEREKMANADRIRYGDAGSRES